MPTISNFYLCFQQKSHDSAAATVVVAPNAVVTQLNFCHLTNNEHNNKTTAVHKTQQHLTTSERNSRFIDLHRMKDSSFLFSI